MSTECLTQCQLLQLLFLTLGANKNTKAVTVGQTPPSLRFQNMYFEALITEIGVLVDRSADLKILLQVRVHRVGR